MLKSTDTEYAPWYIVRSDDKRRARLNLIAHFLSLIPYKEVPRERGAAQPIQKRRLRRHRFDREPAVRAGKVLSSDCAKMLNLFGPHDVLIVSPGTILVRLNKSATISHLSIKSAEVLDSLSLFLGGCRVRLSAAIHPFLEMRKGDRYRKVNIFHWDAIGEFW